MIPVSFTDFETMARTVYGEARGEIWAGQVAVAWVIRNRAELDLGNDGKPDWWGEGIAGVCQRASAAGVHQFSCWNERDPMCVKIKSADSGRLCECLRACFAVLTGEEPDPTHGATHYYAGSIAPPAWAAGLPPIAVIGHHRFFRLV